MDSMWTNLLRQDERCCLAICLAVNCPHNGLTDDTWYPPFDRVKEDINSAAGSRFIEHIISCLCGPLHGKEFVVKVATLLACLKVYGAPDEPDDMPSGDKINLLFELDKILCFDIDNMSIVIKVLEQVLMLSARIWETQAPDDAVHPGILPTDFGPCDDSVSKKMLYIYCCVRILVPDTHESSMHRTRAVFELNTADTSELLLDMLSEDELESAGHPACDLDEGLSEDEFVKTSDSDSGRGSPLSGQSVECDIEFGGISDDDSDFVESSDASGESSDSDAGDI
ncbi:hypothetical protein CGGC5_v005961 [Colletotrichum fructicola Nara gc5]|uniref:Uncharacterized protein n=1 Tax=Colletotrichum fructicola (strain Nara gc5) TaxID=1213859 RepID=A0A7J6JDU3_COLFN|nr:hypothetical protein CGGC5_v005961 [Colletotrichum fructicola Nara gc5]